MTTTLTAPTSLTGSEWNVLNWICREKDGKQYGGALNLKRYLFSPPVRSDRLWCRIEGDISDFYGLVRKGFVKKSKELGPFEVTFDGMRLWQSAGEPAAVENAQPVHPAERHAFILDYLKREISASVVDQPFQDAYHLKFPFYKREFKVWGAMPVKQAQKDLAELERSGILERFRCSLGANWQPGFPKWVWSYSLAEKKATS